MVRTILILSLFCFSPELLAADGLFKLPTRPDRLIEIKRRAEAGEVNAQKAYADELQSTLKYAAAEHWYRRAAITGNPDALSALADLYHGNRGFGTNAIKGNFTNALALHQLVAIQGNRRSLRFQPFRPPFPNTGLRTQDSELNEVHSSTLPPKNPASRPGPPSPPPCGCRSPNIPSASAPTCKKNFAAIPPTA